MGFCVGDQLGIDASATFEDAKDRLFQRAAPALAGGVVAAQAGRAKEAFIDLHDAREGGLVAFLAVEDRGAKAAVVAVDRLAIEAQKMRCLGGREVQTEAAHYFFLSISG